MLKIKHILACFVICSQIPLLQTHKVEERVLLVLVLKWMVVGLGGRLSEKTPPVPPKYIYQS